MNRQGQTHQLKNQFTSRRHFSSSSFEKKKKLNRNRNPTVRPEPPYETIYLAKNEHSSSTTEWHCHHNHKEIHSRSNRAVESSAGVCQQFYPEILRGFNKLPPFLIEELNRAEVIEARIARDRLQDVGEAVEPLARVLYADIFILMARVLPAISDCG